jgi:hypothetical protein
MVHMKKMSKLGGIYLAGIIVASLCLQLEISACQAPLSLGMKEHLSPLLQPQHDSPIGQLELPGETILFPWSEKKRKESNHPASGIMPSSPPQKEEISMNGPQSQVSVQDLKAMNSVKERDVVYEDYQQGDSNASGLLNSRDIQIVGPAGQGDAGQKDVLGDNIERLVDGALACSMNRAKGEKSVSLYGQSLGNNLNIEVSGISVSAINTAEGGNAVANSNIIIKPVQVISTPSEVDEKIR